MEKLKLAIFMEDNEYRQRFVGCIMKHYRESFEIHILDEICKFETDTFDVVLIENKNISDLIVPEKTPVLVLQESVKEKDTDESVCYAEKYQEVYKIMEKLQRMVSRTGNYPDKILRRSIPQRIGIFSLTKEVIQVPFSVLIAEILGESYKVLLVDLQAFSGLSMEVESEGTLGMEDLIAVASTEHYTQNRLTSSIGHEQKWDYIHPVKNTSCLTEVEKHTYQRILEILEKDQMYEYEIINFGAMFSGMIELMESCDQIVFLTETKEKRNYREWTFLSEMNRRGKDMLIEKIKWIEVQKETIKGHSWRQLSQQWLWGSMGDQLRKMFWVEDRDGRIM